VDIPRPRLTHYSWLFLFYGRQKGTQGCLCRQRFQSTDLAANPTKASQWQELVREIEKREAIISGKPRKRKVKLAVRVQYGALPYRFAHDAALEILLSPRGNRSSGSSQRAGR
jgi:hypothetical protein